MDDLITWLRAQLDAREKVAEAAARDGGGAAWSAGDELLGESVSLADGGYIAAGPYGYLSWELRQHIADNDPAFVLADVEAKRQIINLVDSKCGADGGYVDGWEDAATWAVKALALPFAGRPGWREEWRP